MKVLLSFEEHMFITHLINIIQRNERTSDIPVWNGIAEVLSARKSWKQREIERFI